MSGAVAVNATAAEEKTPPLQTVEVSAPDGASQRRNDTAAKIVVGRAEILQHGDSALSDVLKRQPGVSVVGNELRLRGLGAGYTQILLNGEPVAPGFALDSLSPDLIERIEILRTVTADMSTQAIAGSINIVLRKEARRANQQIKLGLQHGSAGFTPSLALEVSDKQKDFSYSLNATAAQNNFAGEPLTTEVLRDANGKLTTLRQFHEHYEFDTNKLSLSPRLNWTLANDDKISWQNLLEYSRTKMAGVNRETTLMGDSSDYPHNAYRSATDLALLRSDLSWAYRISPDAKLDTKFGIHYNKRNIDYFFDGYPPSASGVFVRNVVSDAIDSSVSASGKYLLRYQDAHSLALGWDGGLVRRSEQRLQYDHQPNSSAVGFLDEDYRADVRRLALFAQDEWEVSERLLAYLGLRWEGLRTAIRGRTIVDTNTSSSVLSPVLQALWKLADSEKDQLRFALARTYKAPSTRNLVPRRYTVNNDNNPNNSDFQGNPHLLPELAWGLDAAYEHYFAQSAVFSVAAFVKRIQNVTTYQLFRQDGVWVTSPDNQGRAQVYGIEMDTKFPLSAWLRNAPPVDLHLNVARNWSRFDSVPGPDNRLASQVPLTANLGFDYRRSDRLSMGFNFNFQNGGTVRTSDVLISYSGVARNLDWYSVWKLDKGTQLRVSVANALHQPTLAAQMYQNQGSSLRSSVTPASTVVKILLEKAL